MMPPPLYYDPSQWRRYAACADAQTVGGMHALLALLLLLAPTSVAASEAAAVLSVGTLLLLVCLCVGCCCCAGIGTYFVCFRRMADYQQDIGALELQED